MKTTLAVCALLLGTSCVSTSETHQHGQESQIMSATENLVKALNSKDAVQLKQFVLDNFADPAKADGQVARLNPLVSRGAPFVHVKELPAKTGTQRALIKDKDGILLELELLLTNSSQPKIAGLIMKPYAEESPQKDYSGFTNLKSLAERIQVDTKVPAIGICQIVAGKTEVAVAGNRTLGGPGVGPDEVWSIGSVGKPLCSTIIGHLVDKGRIRWDSKLSEVIPKLVNGTGYPSVTIQQLLQHRSGVAGDTMFTPDMVDRLGGGETNPTKLREKYAKDILKRKPVSPAGSKFSYSNAGYVLLGVVAEKLANHPYEKLVKDWIFSPLKLKSSFTYADKLPASRPMGHGQMPDGFRQMDMSGPIEAMLAPAGGGMYMSLRDMATFANAHLQGLQGKDGLLNASTIQYLHKPSGQPVTPNLDYACGWGLEKHGDLETMHGHNGSNGTMYAQIGIFPKAGLVVVSAMNMGSMRQNAPPTMAVLAVARKAVKNR